MRIGVLTGGGDCPGLNAVIRAVARRSWASGHEVIGVREGWRGMVEQLFEPLGRSQISGILPRGGTIVGTSRTNPYKLDGGVSAVRASFEQIDALVAIGGEDTLGVATRLHADFEAPVVGVPKTIDDLARHALESLATTRLQVERPRLVAAHDACSPGPDSHQGHSKSRSPREIPTAKRD